MRRLALCAVAFCGLVLAPVASAAGPYGFSRPQVGCDTQRGSILVAAPLMAGHDTSGYRDWEYVAWRADLWLWNGTDWQLSQNGKWWWGWSYDNGQARWYADFDGNLLGYTDRDPYAIAAFPNGITSGYWRVSILMYWYNPANPGWYDQTYLWSGATSSSLDGSTDWCYFGG